MKPSRVVVFTVVAIILSLTLATGPLNIIDIPAGGPETTGVGTGSATVEVISEPETVTIREGQAGQNLRYLDIPAVRVSVSSLEGNPILDYSLRVHELGFSTSGVTFLADRGEGTYNLTLDRETFEGERIDRESYTGTIQLVLRGDTETVLFEKEIEIEVKQ